MRITVICSDLSENGLSRASLLSDILANDFDVDLIGSCFGDGIWAPARMREFHRVVKGRWWPMWAATAAELSRAIRGDVIYAIKPLPTSFGLALHDRARTGRPVVLDIDDDELSFRPPASLRRPWRYALGALHPNGRPWARRTIARAHTANAITVASTGLQAQFGGTIVPHAKDTERLRPNHAERDARRRAAGLEGERVVMFMGTLRPFKGVEDVAEAVARMKVPARMVVVGAAQGDAYVAQLARAYPDVRFLPPYALGDVGPILDMADAVVVPQRLTPQTVHQQPSKLLDAMALAKPVVATDVADIGEILSGGRGHVVKPGDVPAMAAALDTIFANPDASREMGERARAWLVEHGSYQAMRPVLRGIMEGVVRPPSPDTARRLARAPGTS